MKSTERIIKAMDEVKALLVRKNKAYGDSALKPANIFAKGNAVENLCSRIDDKLMRIKNRGINADTIDTIDDLIGYLTLLKLAIQDEQLSPRQEDNDVQGHQDNQGTVQHYSWNSTSTSQVGEVEFTDR